MQVRFRSGTLLKAYEQQQVRTKLWGADVARRYVERVNILKAAKAKADLFALPQLRFHPLVGGRAGQYAMTLIGRWRLIVTFNAAETTVEIEEAPQAEADTATVEEVSNHYGD